MHTALRGGGPSPVAHHAGSAPLLLLLLASGGGALWAGCYALQQRLPLAWNLAAQPLVVSQLVG
jgi:hypothetical protein